MSAEIHSKASKLLISKFKIHLKIHCISNSLFVSSKTPILPFTSDFEINLNSNSLSVDLKLQFQNKKFEFEKIIILKSPITSLQKCHLHLRFLLSQGLLSFVFHSLYSKFTNGLKYRSTYRRSFVTLNTCEAYLFTPLKFAFTYITRMFAS